MDAGGGGTTTVLCRVWCCQLGAGAGTVVCSRNAKAAWHGGKRGRGWVRGKASTWAADRICLGVFSWLGLGLLERPWPGGVDGVGVEAGGWDGRWMVDEGWCGRGSQSNTDVLTEYSATLLLHLTEQLATYLGSMEYRQRNYQLASAHARPPSFVDRLPSNNPIQLGTNLLTAPLALQVQGSGGHAAATACRLKVSASAGILQLSRPTSGWGDKSEKHGGPWGTRGSRGA